MGFGRTSSNCGHDLARSYATRPRITPLRLRQVDERELRLQRLWVLLGLRFPILIAPTESRPARHKYGGQAYLLVSGGGSNILYDKRDTREESEFFTAKSHFVILELYPDRIGMTAYGLGGEVLDSCTLQNPSSD